MRPLIPYDRYTKLFSKRIQRTATPAEFQDFNRVKATQPANCPMSNARIHSTLLPEQIVHDSANCPGKSAA